MRGRVLSLKTPVFYLRTRVSMKRLYALGRVFFTKISVKRRIGNIFMHFIQKMHFRSLSKYPVFIVVYLKFFVCF